MTLLDPPAQSPYSHGLEFPAEGPRGLLVCFDYEGRWGMPFPATYDLAESTGRILQTLARHDVRATFFVVGELATEHSDLMRAIASGGHEIALHGWRHERLDRLGAGELARFGEGLARATATIETITGARPKGFRAPYLLAPRFFDAAVYELLVEQGFRWVSNREIRHLVELFRPDRLRTRRPWQYVQSHPALLRGPGARAMLLALNANVYRRSGWHRTRSQARWLVDGYPPFYREAMLEIPVYGPLDCDLLGVPAPSAPSAQPLLDFARFALGLCLGPPGYMSMLTFHDWIIAGGNRLSLLDGVLSLIRDANLRPTTVEMWLAARGSGERRSLPA